MNGATKSTRRAPNNLLAFCGKLFGGVNNFSQGVYNGPHNAQKNISTEKEKEGEKTRILKKKKQCWWTQCPKKPQSQG